MHCTLVPARQCTASWQHTVNPTPCPTLTPKLLPPSPYPRPIGTVLLPLLR